MQDGEKRVPRNKLLGALSPEVLRRLVPQFEQVHLGSRRTLHLPRLPIEHVYFVECGLVSVSTHLQRDSAGVEAWLIGQEGVAGLPVILGVDTSPHRRTVLVEGCARRIPAAALRHLVDDCPPLRSVLLRYAYSTLIQTAQIGACNAGHSIRQRTARWLLMADDRLGGVPLRLTHAAVARVLGVRRASVSAALDQFQADGSVSHRRGQIQLTDRQRLERHACQCYRIIAAEARLGFEAVQRIPQAAYDPIG